MCNIGSQIFQPSSITTIPSIIDTATMQEIKTKAEPSLKKSCSQINNIINESSNAPIANSEPSKTLSLEATLNNAILLLDALSRYNCKNCNVESHEQNQFLCKWCNAFFCPSCSQIAACQKCKDTVCSLHSIQCSACKSRVCFNSECYHEITLCQICQMPYCSSHFDEHKKFNQKELYKIRCNFEKCKIAQGIGIQGIDELSKCFIHMIFIKELRLRKPLKYREQ